ncbi:3-oxo-tetronate kinase [Aquabacter cavernae]|uniref:3-oxo-tetronate kinase n=1 Tax=Aquabacter cavernae TaxID=2496029 RepID=UPI000F8CF2FC|nr:3-oxo-tetronate kinase [Aquabacter cavernae]
MPLILGAVADDYTGASDLANTFTKAGLRTVQTIGVPDPALPLPEVDAVVVALKSRSIPAPEAVALSRAAARWLRERGAGHVLFKVCSTFDSTDAGNIGPVTDALRADVGAGPVIVTPAFPETGRTIYLGHLFVGPVPLNESPLKDHPLNPMHDANLVRVLARQSAAPVGLLDLPTVEAGPGAVRARLATLAAEGAGAAIADAVFERHLEVLGEVALDGPLSTGASGLGLGLARALVRAGKPGRVTTGEGVAGEGLADVGGPAAILAGSCSAATLSQIAEAEKVMPVLRLDGERLVTAGAQAVEAALAWAHERLSHGPVLIAASGTPAQVAALQAKHGRAASGHAIEQASAALAEGLVAAGVRRLVVAGGETSGAVVDRLGLTAFLLGPEIAPGVPVLATVGSRPDMRLALKSGNFGGPDFFARALEAVR